MATWETGSRAGAHGRRGAVPRGTVVLAIAGVLLLVAAWLVFRTSTSDDTPAEPLPFHCVKCGHDFQIGAAELEKLIDQRQYKGDERERKFFIKCRKCGEFAAERQQ